VVKLVKLVTLDPLDLLLGEEGVTPEIWAASGDPLPEDEE
jgi:hypothetical protein